MTTFTRALSVCFAPVTSKRPAAAVEVKIHDALKRDGVRFVANAPAVINAKP